MKCKAKGNPPTTYHIWRWENGTVIQNRSKGDLQLDNIDTQQGGRLSCAGGSYIGEGKREYINLLVRGEYESSLHLAVFLLVIVCGNVSGIAEKYSIEYDVFV